MVSLRLALWYASPRTQNLKVELREPFLICLNLVFVICCFLYADSSLLLTFLGAGLDLTDSKLISQTFYTDTGGDWRY